MGASERHDVKHADDLTGRRFGRLIVQYRVADYVTPGGQHKAKWHCICDCGRTKDTTATNLKTGCTKSCGCYSDESRRSNGKLIAKHGGFGTRLYRIYRGMWQRCNDKNDPHYLRYGKRGIYICTDWLGENGFEKFREWALQNGYKDSLSIDRIDNDKGYSPENCRWATVREQQNNRNCNVKLTYKGETHTMAEWACISGINVATIKGRHRAGWSDEDILTRPVDRRKASRQKCESV